MSLETIEPVGLRVLISKDSSLFHLFPNVNFHRIFPVFPVALRRVCTVVCSVLQGNDWGSVWPLFRS